MNGLEYYIEREKRLLRESNKRLYNMLRQTGYVRYWRNDDKYATIRIYFHDDFGLTSGPNDAQYRLSAMYLNFLAYNSAEEIRVSYLPIEMFFYASFPNGVVTKGSVCIGSKYMNQIRTVIHNSEVDAFKPAVLAPYLSWLGL